MNPAQLLQFEGRVFLVLLAGTLAWMMLTRRIALTGLLLRDDGEVSPERVQLLVSTLAVSGHLLGVVLGGKAEKMPEIDPQWLIAFGASGAVYTTVKAALAVGGRQRGRLKR